MKFMTPWGYSQHREQFSNGLVFHSTARHGGMWVPPHLLKRIPEEHQKFAERWSGSRQWYEEDCSILAVYLAFPEQFPRFDAGDFEEMKEALADYMERGNQ